MRDADLIDHAGRRAYTDRVRAAVAAARGDEPGSEDLDAAVTAVEAALPPARPPETNGTAPGASERARRLGDAGRTPGSPGLSPGQVC